MLGSRRWKGGHPGGQKKGGRKGGHRSRILVPMKDIKLRSCTSNFWGKIHIFSYSHMVISIAHTCPPFAPPFLKFLFLKNMISQDSPESKINFIRWFLTQMWYLKLKKLNFYIKSQKMIKKSYLEVQKIIDFFTLWSKFRNDTELALSVIWCSFLVQNKAEVIYFTIRRFLERGGKRGGTYVIERVPILKKLKKNHENQQFHHRECLKWYLPPLCPPFSEIFILKSLFPHNSLE